VGIDFLCDIYRRPYTSITMRPTGDDWDLLRQYAHERSEAAFERIVRRHVNLVFSAALRRVRNRQLAEDVTQAVFVILARKAKGLGRGDGGPMSGWLLTTVRYAACNAIKMEARRRRHERAAATAASIAPASAECSPNPSEVLIWKEIAGLLDDAVLGLAKTDRQAVLLRYFEGRGMAEVASELNVSEAAVRQRLSRAMEKLRQRLSHRAGAAAPTIDAALLTALLASHAPRGAPPGLALASCAAATGGAAASGIGIAIAKGAMTMMAWTKAKAAAVVVGVMVIGGAGGVVAMRSAAAVEKAPAAAVRTTVAAQALVPAAQKPQPAAEADKNSGAATISLAAAPPVVVQTVPQAGAGNVDATITEIKVTYSKDMADGSWSWSTWGKDSFPKTTGKPRYLADHRTCVLPVQLQPGRTYAMWLNSSNFGNFKDTAGQTAVPYLLVFETKK
jgi:RNA polymerase sigma factor (sigma-70 family)